MEDWNWGNINIQMLFRHLHRLRDPNDATEPSDSDSRPTLDTFLDSSSHFNFKFLRAGGSPTYSMHYASRWNTKAEVVCKITAGYWDSEQAIRQEATFYESNAGKELQDCHYIPHYYGIYGGEFRDETVVCIVLERCGQAFDSWNALMRQGKDFCMATLEIFKRLHQLGWRKGMYHIGEILCRPDGSPCLVDFTEAEPHKCEENALTDIEFGGREPLNAVPMCADLRGFCVAAQIWVPDTATMRGVTYIHDPEHPQTAEQVWKMVKEHILLDDADGIELVREIMETVEARLQARKEAFGL